MILMYHKVFPESPTMWWVTVNNFYRQMLEISNKEIVYLDDYEIGNENQVVITFDGVYKNVLDYALPILIHFGYSFELFLTSDYIGKNNFFDNKEAPAEFASIDELKKLVNHKGRLQWHTRSHKNLKEITDIAEINQELEIPKEIRELDKSGFNWFAYPHGELNEIVKNEVSKVFRGAVSCNQGSDDDKYMLNRVTVTDEVNLNKKSRVACIIASYNYGQFLVDAVESVLRQTILPDEILISDDFSNDETEIIARKYTRKYPTLISYNRNEANLGVVDHFNKAIKLVNSEFVLFLGADNLLQSNYIEMSKQVLMRNENIGVAYTDYALFGSRAKLVYSNFPPQWQNGIKEDYHLISFPESNLDNSEILEKIKRRNFIHGSSMFRKKAYDSVGGYIKSKRAEDHNLFIRILENGWKVEKVQGTNLEYRQHSDGQLNSVHLLQNKMIFYKEEMIFYKKSLQDYKKLKTGFENSKFFKWSYKLYRVESFIKKNYQDPKRILSKVFPKIKFKGK